MNSFQLVGIGIFIGIPAVLAVPPAVKEYSVRRFFIAWGLSFTGVVLPLFVFFMSVFLAPDSKAVCHDGWLDCFIGGKLALSPMVLWATAALYALEVMRVKDRTARWLVLGTFTGATIALVCLVFGLICFLPEGDVFAQLWLLVPLYVAVWYSVRAWQLIKVSPYGARNYVWTLAGSLPLWLASVWWSYRTYQSLPEVDNCFVVTAAGRGHEPFVGPFREITRHGHKLRANQQLITFWRLEALWQSRAPRSHAGFRRIYNRIGPVLARRINSPWRADAVCATLKPLERAARLVLKFTPVRWCRVSIGWITGCFASASPPRRGRAQFFLSQFFLSSSGR
jgi:hypothetical protein